MSTILVVEDDAVIAEDMQHTLEQLGYKVPRTAASGYEAECALEVTPANLVLMDIKLGGKQDGIETAARIKKRWDIPVIYVTSHCDEGTLRRARETQPYGYVLKPFSTGELKCAVRGALAQREIERQRHGSRWSLVALQAINEAVLATDANEVITFMNLGAERLTGCSSREALGKELSRVLRIVDSSAGANRATVDAGSVAAKNADAEIETPDGRRLSVEYAIAPVSDTLGPLTGTIVVLHDVTAQRKLEQRLAMTERLASIGSMAAGMAHEINNPLAGVVSNLEFGLQAVQEVRSALRAVPDLAYAYGLSSAVTESLSDALNAATRLRRIVHDLKKFSRTDRAGLELLELPALLDAALKLTSNQTKHKARVVKSYGNTPHVVGNEGKLVQVFTNLLLNAAQAINEGQASANEISVKTYAEGANAVIEVQDTGSGIPVHLRDQIFAPFFTTKSVDVGMGLGLSICHNIVNALGGEIGFTSDVGVGTTFRVWLPGATARELAQRSEPPPRVTSRRARVLVLDDEEVIGRAVARLLGADHDVTIETSGQRAIDRVGAGEVFDIILCDLMMADVSGMDVFDALQRIHPTSADRIVFLTGGAFSPGASEFLQTVRNPTINKPFTVEQLKSIVAEYADKANAN